MDLKFGQDAFEAKKRSIKEKFQEARRKYVETVTEISEELNQLHNSTLKELERCFENQELEGINVVSEFLDELYALYNSLEKEMFLGCIHGVKKGSFLGKEYLQERVFGTENVVKGRCSENMDLKKKISDDELFHAFKEGVKMSVVSILSDYLMNARITLDITQFKYIAKTVVINFLEIHEAPQNKEKVTMAVLSKKSELTKSVEKEVKKLQKKSRGKEKMFSESNEKLSHFDKINNVHPLEKHLGILVQSFLKPQRRAIEDKDEYTKIYKNILKNFIREKPKAMEDEEIIKFLSENKEKIGKAVEVEMEKLLKVKEERQL